MDVHALCQTYQRRFGHSDWIKYGASTLLDLRREDSTPLELERCGGVSRKGRRELSEQKIQSVRGHRPRRVVVQLAMASESFVCTTMSCDLSIFQPRPRYRFVARSESSYG